MWGKKQVVIRITLDEFCSTNLKIIKELNLLTNTKDSSYESMSCLSLSLTIYKPSPTFPKKNLWNSQLIHHWFLFRQFASSSIMAIQPLVFFIISLLAFNNIPTTMATSRTMVFATTSKPLSEIEAFDLSHHLHGEMGKS